MVVCCFVVLLLHSWVAGMKRRRLYKNKNWKSVHYWGTLLLYSIIYYFFQLFCSLFCEIFTPIIFTCHYNPSLPFLLFLFIVLHLYSLSLSSHFLAIFHFFIEFSYMYFYFLFFFFVDLAIFSSLILVCPPLTFTLGFFLFDIPYTPTLPPHSLSISLPFSFLAPYSSFITSTFLACPSFSLQLFLLSPTPPALPHRPLIFNLFTRRNLTLRRCQGERRGNWGRLVTEEGEEIPEGRHVIQSVIQSSSSSSSTAFPFLSRFYAGQVVSDMVLECSACGNTL